MSENNQAEEYDSILAKILRWPIDLYIDPLKLAFKNELGTSGYISAFVHAAALGLSIGYLLGICKTHNREAWLRPFFPFYLSLAVISCIYPTFITFGHDNNETRHRFRWTIVLLFLFLMNAIILMFSLHHIGIWRRLNNALVHLLYYCSGATDHHAFNAFLMDCKERLNVVPFVTSFLGTGLLVLSLSNDRHRSNLNPYTFKQYFPVLPFLCLMLFIMVALIYFVVVQVYALLIFATIAHIALCISISVYFHVLHTSQFIADQMSSVLKKKIGVFAMQIEEDSFHSDKDCRKWSENPVLEDMVLWKRQLLQNTKKVGDSLYAQVTYHALALSKVCEQLPHILRSKNKAKTKEYLDYQEYLPFAMGLWIGSPAYGIDDASQRMYFRFMLDALYKHKNTRNELYMKQMMCGMMAARLLEAYRPILPNEMGTTLLNEQNSEREEENDRCKNNVESCVRDCAAALQSGHVWYTELIRGNDKKRFLEMWIVYTILAPIYANVEKANWQISRFECYKNIFQTCDAKFFNADASYSKELQKTIKELWELYKVCNFMDIYMADNVKGALEVVKELMNAGSVPDTLTVHEGSTPIPSLSD